ncbi:MAG: rhomboid family intramembrane serine protease [Bacteroidota bacterium]
MNSPLEDLKKFFKGSNALNRLIIINIAVFFSLRIMFSIFALFNVPPDSYRLILNQLMLPSSVYRLALQPWSLFTYMFVHEDFMHIFSNMLWLYIFGKIFLYYKGGRMLTTVYVLGGLSGGLLYVLAFNVFPLFTAVVQHSYAMGASAGILAIVIATATYVPDYAINLIFLGPVKLKYIALFSVMSDAINIQSGNAGGHIAHLGGAIFGYIFIKQMQQGNNIGKWFENLLENLKTLFKPKPKIRVVHKRPLTDEQYNEQRKARQDEIDRILDKIAKSGYDSLSKQEKEILFKESSK